MEDELLGALTAAERDAIVSALIKLAGRRTG